MADTKWTTEWPTEPGLYWFYGWTFTRDYSGLPTYHTGKVIMNSSGHRIYLIDGAFAYRSENNHKGMWHLAELPPVPDLTNV